MLHDTFFFYIFTYIVNVALNKPAHQQNSYRNGNALYDASNAVDGLKSNLRYDGGQCTVSADGHQTATWWVNLTSLHSIHHITIYYRTDNVAWSTYLFDIEIYVTSVEEFSLSSFLLQYKANMSLTPNCRGNRRDVRKQRHTSAIKRGTKF